MIKFLKDFFYVIIGTVISVLHRAKGIVIAAGSLILSLLKFTGKSLGLLAIFISLYVPALAISSIYYLIYGLINYIVMNVAELCFKLLKTIFFTLAPICKFVVETLIRFASPIIVFPFLFLGICSILFLHFLAIIIVTLVSLFLQLVSNILQLVSEMLLLPIASVLYWLGIFFLEEIVVKFVYGVVCLNLLKHGVSAVAKVISIVSSIIVGFFGVFSFILNLGFNFIRACYNFGLFLANISLIIYSGIATILEILAKSIFTFVSVVAAFLSYIFAGIFAYIVFPSSLRVYKWSVIGFIYLKFIAKLLCSIIKNFMFKPIQSLLISLMATFSLTPIAFIGAFITSVITVLGGAIATALLAVKLIVYEIIQLFHIVDILTGLYVFVKNLIHALLILFSFIFKECRYLFERFSDFASIIIGLIGVPVGLVMFAVQLIAGIILAISSLIFAAVSIVALLLSAVFDVFVFVAQPFINAYLEATGNQPNTTNASWVCCKLIGDAISSKFKTLFKAFGVIGEKISDIIPTVTGCCNSIIHRKNTKVESWMNSYEGFFRRQIDSNTEEFWGYKTSFDSNKQVAQQLIKSVFAGTPNQVKDVGSYCLEVIKSSWTMFAKACKLVKKPWKDTYNKVVSKIISNTQSDIKLVVKETKEDYDSITTKVDDLLSEGVYSTLEAKIKDIFESDFVKNNTYDFFQIGSLEPNIIKGIFNKIKDIFNKYHGEEKFEYIGWRFKSFYDNITFKIFKVCKGLYSYKYINASLGQFNNNISTIKTSITQYKITSISSRKVVTFIKANYKLWKNNIKNHICAPMSYFADECWKFLSTVNWFFKTCFYSPIKSCVKTICKFFIKIFSIDYINEHRKALFDNIKTEVDYWQTWNWSKTFKTMCRDVNEAISLHFSSMTVFNSTVKSIDEDYDGSINGYLKSDLSGFFRSLLEFICRFVALIAEALFVPQAIYVLSSTSKENHKLGLGKDKFQVLSGAKSSGSFQSEFARHASAPTLSDNLETLGFLSSTDNSKTG